MEVTTDLGHMFYHVGFNLWYTSFRKTQTQTGIYDIGVCSRQNDDNGAIDEKGNSRVTVGRVKEIQSNKRDNNKNFR